jgi:exodeoxyribonuclease V gamma subunit
MVSANGLDGICLTPCAKSPTSKIMITPQVFPHENIDLLLEALLKDLQDSQRTATPVAALKLVPIIVPSIQFTDWLQVAIAKRKGLCMGFEFIMPQEFISRVIALGGPVANAVNPWSKANLTWRILPHIKVYAGQLGVTDPSPRDRFALAGLLADQFDQYGHFRPEIIAKWNRGESAAKSVWSREDKANEEWQRGLWRKVQSDINASTSPRPHLALELETLAMKEEFLKALKTAFPHLLVVGTGVLDPLLVRVLGLLGQASCKVQTHMVLPSLGYLGELRNSRREIEQDPESVVMNDGHPLLVSMGRHAVGSFLLLGEVDENYSQWPDSPAGREEAVSPSSLLGCIQAEVRHLRMPSKSYKTSETDISLGVHSCFGPRREMEVLRDELLRAFRDLKDLKPEEVIVVTPSLEAYAPLVTAVLEQDSPLPVRLTELPLAEQDPVAEGLLALLEMALGRHEASTLLELLHLRAVHACLGISNDSTSLDRLSDWVRRSGLTRGLDGGVEGSPFFTGSWRFARDRMIAGEWFGDEVAAQYPSEEYVLPIGEDLGGDLDLRHAFIEWHWLLARTMHEWRVEATPGTWSDRLRNACDELLSSKGDEDSRLEIQYPLSFLEQLDCKELVDAAAIYDWLRSEGGQSSKRTLFSGRITFGRCKQLQNIPCRVLAMVGMQDGAFPRQNRIPAWDLLHCDPRAWDRNARIDDRQLFLDAVLTPTDRLIITASTRNVRSGKLEPFSSCVDELLRVAQATTENERTWVIKHRLQPFAFGYFSANSGGAALPSSFDSNSARVAESLLKSSTQPQNGFPFWNPEVSIEERKTGEPLELTVDQVVNFWKEPTKAFIKAQGIALPFEEGDDEALDLTPLGLDKLQEWSVKSSIVEGIIEDGSSLDYTKALLFADRGLPPLQLGNLKWDSLYSTAQPLGRSVSELKTDILSMDFAVPGTTPPVRITGRFLQGKTDEGAVLLAYRVGKFKNAKDYIQPWVQAIVAACAGHSMCSCLLDEESPEEPNVLETYNLDRAEELLRHLINGYLQGQSRPICYAPDENAIKRASEKWNAQPFNGAAGEGFSASANLTWRDRDPFAHEVEWHRWARYIAKPLRAWFSPE